ncbi:EamA family transporter [Streptomyces sp. ODS28]|uniref:EamA family transporter n=1 Tax=Streptomyces sp. ODS28 TaxID=3136688 RepID=UPI0031E69A94
MRDQARDDAPLARLVGDVGSETRAVAGGEDEPSYGAVAVALLSTVLAKSLEPAALRRISPATFGILVSLEPVAAALLGLALLGQTLAWPQWLATACIVTAAAGTTADRNSPRRRRRGQRQRQDRRTSRRLRRTSVRS